MILIRFIVLLLAIPVFVLASVMERTLRRVGVKLKIHKPDPAFDYEYWLKQNMGISLQLDAQDRAANEARTTQMPVDDGYGTRHYPPGKDGLPVMGKSP